MTDDLDPLCAHLRAERLNRGLSLRAVALPMGLSATHLSGYENGRAKPSLPTLHAWAYLLGYDVTLTPRQPTT